MNAFGLIALVTLLFRGGPSTSDLAIFLVMFSLTLLGIEVGYHRLFAHRTFEASRPLAIFLGVAGSMALQGSALGWATLHRIHHRSTDRPGDPHAPEVEARGWLRGWWHAHIGWYFDHEKPPIDFRHFYRYGRDLLADPVLRGIDRFQALWVLLGLLFPALAGYLIGRTAEAAWLGFLWGGPIRICAAHHATWSVNSFTHMFGRKPFDTGDHSSNLMLVALLTHGVGWHNNHHAFPGSARTGLRWWEIDTGYWFIRACERLGLAWNVKLPSSESASSRTNS